MTTIPVIFFTVVIGLLSIFQISAFPAEKDVSGIYALGKLNHELGRNSLTTLMENPGVNGFSIRMGWKEIEPNRGQYGWSQIDNIIERVSKYNKKVSIRIYAGASSPDWVYSEGAEKFEFTDNDSNTVTMPIPWDPVYFRYWKAFVNKLGQKYSDNPTVALIHMTGPTAHGEMHLEDKKNEDAWLAQGYSNDKMIRAWKITIRTYDLAFPSTQLAISIASPVNFGDPELIVQEVIDFAYTRLGTDFSIQGNWLHPNVSDSFLYYDYIKQYSSLTTTGFQMLWNYTFDNGQRLGGSLEDAIQRGLEAGARYLELYPVDINNPELEQVIYDAHVQLTN